jgi:hypothetical protein
LGSKQNQAAINNGTLIIEDDFSSSFSLGLLSHPYSQQLCEVLIDSFHGLVQVPPYFLAEGRRGYGADVEPRGLAGVSRKRI